MPFSVLLTRDGEIGGENGVQKKCFMNSKLIFALTWMAAILKKSLSRKKLSLKLISKGKTAHGARPWLGENAIERLIADYPAIADFFDISAPDHRHLGFSIMPAEEALSTRSRIMTKLCLTSAIPKR